MTFSYLRTNKVGQQAFQCCNHEACAAVTSLPRTQAQGWFSTASLPAAAQTEPAASVQCQASLLPALKALLQPSPHHVCFVVPVPLARSFSRHTGTTGLSSECSHEDATGKGVPSLNSKCSQQPLKAGTSSVCQCRE